MSIRRAAMWSLASQYTAFVIQFATSVIISRFYLLPADVGLFSIALAVAMMVAIFQDMGISRFVTGQPEMDIRHVRAYAAVAVGIGWLVAAIVALAATPVAQFYTEPGLADLLSIIAVSYLASPFAIIPVALLSRAMDFRALFAINAGSALAGGIVAVGFAASGAGPASLAWGMLAAALARAGMALLAHPVLPGRPRDLAVIRPLLGFGSSAFVLSLSGSVGMRSQDLIIGRMLGFTATGLFTRASALAGQMSNLVVGAINGVFYPAFARKRDRGEPLVEPYLHLVACNTALNWAAVGGLALAAEPVVQLLYGPNWAEVAPLLRWTALAEALFFAVPLQMDIPILMGRIRTLVWINLLDTVATIAILTVFSLWGLEAAAISRLWAAALWFAIYITYIARLLNLPAGRLAMVYFRSAVCALSAGLPLLAARQLGWFGPDMSPILLILLCAAGALLWLIALRLLGHPAWQEVRLVAASLTRRLPSPLQA